MTAGSVAPKSSPHRVVKGGAMPRFLIADDHKFVCDALALLIARHWPCAAVSQAHSFDGAMRLLADATFDVAVLDFCMPGLDGGPAVDQIRRLYPDLKIVILSGAIEPSEALLALDSGIVAYIPKSMAGDGIVHILMLVLEGETYVPRDLIEAIARAPAGGLDAGDLSDRDTTLLKALIKGYPNKVIAHAMGISEGTVKLYLHNLFHTLGVHNRTEAVACALSQNRGPPPGGP
jgi:two-component system, NarL family, nitrate/nitrite response regulator NarL